MAASITGTEENPDKADESAVRDMSGRPSTIPTVVGVLMEDDSVVNSSKKRSDFEDSDRPDIDETSGRSSSEKRREGDSESTGADMGTTVVGLRETKNVNRSKMLVYLVLLLAAFTVGFATYYFLSKEEEEAFEENVHDFSIEILDAANDNAENFLGKLLTVSNTITAFAAATAVSWPNITIQNWDILTTDSIEKFVGPELFLFAPVVPNEKRSSWEEYAVQHQDWIKEDLFLRGLQNIKPGDIPDEIYSFFGDDEFNSNFSIPIWQVGPVPTNADIVMLDLYTHPSFRRIVDDVNTVGHILLSEVVDRSFLAENIETLDRDPMRDNHPRSYAAQPVYDSFASNATIVGYVFAVVPWDTYFVNVLPYGTNNFVIQVIDSCGTSFSYLLQGPEAIYLGEDFEPDDEFDYLVVSGDFATFARHDETGDTNDEILQCSYTISVHATSEYEDEFTTNKPIYLTVIVIVVFVFTAMVFVLYDFFVQRRQRRVLQTAQTTNAIVASLFPKNVAKMLLDEEDRKQRKISVSGKDKLRSFFEGGIDGDEGQDDGYDSGGAAFKTKPIADFFPETTIMFADIVGFTAWSSTREPSQVFTLLETIYHEFDAIAKQRRVFKVETVGDCYVAVAGLPDPRKDHAVVMARFARECMTSLQFLTKRLEVSLGPDTADLSMRIGLHSGPVTAGVLRGDRARFQLFGDTMNIASRMESNGIPSRIHVSSEFAHELNKVKKGHWVVARRDLVRVKGKGNMQTYFLEFKNDDGPRNGGGYASAEFRSEDGASSDGGDTKDYSKELFMQEVKSYGVNGLAGDAGTADLTSKVERLVEWNVDLLTSILKDIVARREGIGAFPDPDSKLTELENEYLSNKGDVLSEAQEIIALPPFWKGKSRSRDVIKIDKKVTEQLHSFILKIARSYQDNPFHNFEHASHVTMSVVKLFSRIVAPDQDNLGENSNARGLHDHTYGITSDPITQFAVILSALIHDADHPGVPNTQLINEGDPLAKHYKNKSIAEQNSVDIAWKFLMLGDFKDLRRTIYRTEQELRRFRQLVVNTVLATDIMDPDLKQLRNDRWDKAFKECKLDESCHDKTNRKATIVIEHLIQASDVAHTMQHWHIYRKWNARLFEEMFRAYLEGRSAKDPTEFWYKGEIGFLDFYVIPLAKKLQNCGVFGVSSDEYLQYALNNRKEWEQKGESVVSELVQKVWSNKAFKPLIEKRGLTPPTKAIDETEIGE